MGGASDHPLATAADRNGLVSGVKPWNRGVLQRKEPSASSGNGRRGRCQRPLERMRDGIDRLAGPTQPRRAASTDPCSAPRCDAGGRRPAAPSSDGASERRGPRPVRRSTVSSGAQRRSLRSPTQRAQEGRRLRPQPLRRREATDLRHLRRTSVPRRGASDCFGSPRALGSPPLRRRARPSGRLRPPLSSVFAGVSSEAREEGSSEEVGVQR
jgi:hypothetical protein